MHSAVDIQQIRRLQLARGTACGEWHQANSCADNGLCLRRGTAGTPFYLAVVIGRFSTGFRDIFAMTASFV
jgi:hypothetical protein